MIIARPVGYNNKMAEKTGKKHPCEDCEFCQFCSDSRCNMCRGGPGSKKKCDKNKDKIAKGMQEKRP
jgi:hypothetical protein